MCHLPGEQNALEQLRAVEHLHHRSQKACAELEARVVLLERQCAGMSEQLSERMTEVRRCRRCRPAPPQPAPF